MADAILELLDPHLNSSDSSSLTTSRPRVSSTDATTTKYLNRLTSLSLEQIRNSEPQSISQSAHSTLLSLQALSNRSHKALISSSDHLSTLRNLIPSLGKDVKTLQERIPILDSEAVRFSTTYSKSSDNPNLDRRKKAMQLSRNVDRISDVLELPALLSTAVSTSSANAGLTAASGNYSTALDLYSHIKRLQTLYPDSPLIKDIISQAEDAMKTMTTNLIAGLRTQNIRLAAAMRTIGWLRRVAPELENPRRSRETGTGTGEGSLGALFLVCRLANLVSTLEALDPLRELADQETQRRVEAAAGERASSSKWSGGQQTERYLKRYIEIYREQSFAIVSLYKNIFTPEPVETDSKPITVPGLDLKSLNLKTQPPPKPTTKIDPLQALPPAVATFPLYLVRLLTDTLRTYLPNVRDKSSRESLLTQVLYCAASLGRLGGDFSMILTELEDEEQGKEAKDETVVHEWEEVMRKHRALAGRLEQLTSGQAVTKSISRVTSPGEYPILLGDKLAKDDGGNDSTFINITYNHKSKSATANQRAKITRSPTSQDVYNLIITDKAGNAEQTTLEYKYKGSIDPSIPVQGSEARNLVLVFDPSRKAFILEPVSTSLNFNLRAAPGKNKEVIEQYEQLHTLGDDGDHASRDESDDEQPEDADQDNPYDFRHFLKKPESEKAKSNLSTTTTPDPHGTISTPAMQATKVEAKKAAPSRPKQQTNPLRQPKRAPKAKAASTNSSAKAKPQPKSAPRVDPEDDIVISDAEPSEKEEDEYQHPQSSQAIPSPSSNIIVEGDLIIDMGSPPTRPTFKVDPTHFSSSDHSVNGTDEEGNEEDDEEIEHFRLPSPARPAAAEEPAADEDENDEDEDALAAEMEAAFEEEASRTQSMQQTQRYVPSDDESEISEEE
ncbi:Dor1-like family protein [Talaromyces stipitatus ATCC 10500]|uniref:Conserved oligomeric Golgi complex subunit 8 n=1 Tax=Talaromyces stipitatus (strain ATCC 10500 / CBS 375.48 / QM 6759 / NRRL 1006) TaxID=441959 RepID=B8M6Q4_TALSN|nr:Dor1-like family protein [Talaromyces stipitatus ATCC 10500]EED19516.1 Dor1-like family protein [Talaromyces stipitatus ATCC 10500]